MKKKTTILLLALIPLFLNVSSIKASENFQLADYFTGKWEVSAKGLPQGDAQLIITFERTEGKRTGTIFDKTNPDEAYSLTSFEETDTTLTCIYQVMGMDVTLYLTKSDNGKVSGNLMDMFDLEGSRIDQ